MAVHCEVRLVTAADPGVIEGTCARRAPGALSIQINVPAFHPTYSHKMVDALSDPPVRKTPRCCCNVAIGGCGPGPLAGASIWHHRSAETCVGPS